MTDQVSSSLLAASTEGTTKSTDSAIKEATTKVGSDFETFLKMLTTQLDNQDPLNPLESNDFAVQLATFSGVEQQVLTNEMLEKLSSQLAVSGIESFSSWIGKEVPAESEAAFQAEPLTVVVDASPGSVSSKLVVRDTDGRIVDQQKVPLAGDDIEWPATTETANKIPSGIYQFSQVGTDENGVESEERPVSVFQKVIEVQLNEGIPTLILTSGASIPSKDVSAVRASQ